MSGFKEWEHRDNAQSGLIFPQNIGPYLSIDETSLSHGELFTVITNKEAKGKKGSLVAIIEGTKAEKIMETVEKISIRERKKVQEVTLDLAGNMALAVKKCFPNATQVIDRFHVEQLASEALQEIRIKHRWEAIEAENKAAEAAKHQKLPFQAEILENGDSLKQLLARSRYLLYKHKEYWTQSQEQRAALLFDRYPDIKKAYELTQQLKAVFSFTKDKRIAFTRLARWHNLVEHAGFKSFNTISRTIEIHHQKILNYFDNKSTNASAESFNAKIKSFRAQFRGVRDINFFLFRLTKLYA